MGRDHTIFGQRKGSELQLNAPLTVIASEGQLEELRSSSGAGWISDAQFISLQPDEPIEGNTLDATGVVLFEVDPASPASMDRIRNIRRMHPEMPQIVAMRDVDMRLVRTLIREGVADVVELPFNAEEILQTVIAVLETHAGSVGKDVALAPLIAVTKPIGGAGATTIASHLAAELASEPGEPTVCLFDLDIQSGRICEVFGVSPRRTLTDLLEAGTRLDASMLDTVAERHECGVDLIAAPNEIIPIEALKSEDLARVLDLARAEYDYVVLDMPSGLTNWGLAILAKADSIVMLVEQSLPSLRQARRRLDLFKNLGLDHRLVSVVVNRVEKKLFKSIGIDDVEEALGRPVTAKLARDTQTLEAAQDRGVLAGHIRRKSPFVADVAALADAITARMDGGEQ